MRRLTLLLLGLLWAISSPIGLWAETRTLTLQEYVSFLNQLARHAEEAVSLELSYALLMEVSSLDSTYEITWQNGNQKLSEQVDTRWMETMLTPYVIEAHDDLFDEPGPPQGPKPGVHLAKVFAASLRLHIREMEEMGGLTPGDTSTLQVKDILNERRYEERNREAENYEQPDVSWIGKVGEFIEKYFNLILVLVIMAGLIILLFRLGRYLDLRRKKDEIPIISGGLLRPGDPTDSATLLKAAQEATDLPTRIRYAYLTLIIRLHENGTIPYQASWTAWEYYREIIRKGYPKAASLDLTSTFDQTTYGLVPVTQESYSHFDKCWQECMDIVQTGGSQ